MRILHFSDVHIGVENYGKIDPETGLSTRLIDFLDAYDEVVSYALDNHVDLVLFCGDAYKSRDPNQTHQREFATRIARLSAAGIPVFLLTGNHDSPHVIGRATALEIFQTLVVDKVYYGDSLKTYSVQTSDGPIQIVAVPWIRRSALLARNEIRGLSPAQINDAIQERLSRVIRMHAQNLDVGIPAVLAGHVTVSGSITGSEQSMMLGRDHILLRSNVSLPEFDYVALGHIHRHQILWQKPLVVYSGSIQRVDFGEEKDAKGFCVFDLDPTKPVGQRVKNFKFHTTNARRFITVTVKIRDGDPDPTATVIKEISKHRVEEAIIRLRITIPGDLTGSLRESDIRKAMESAHFIASISRDVSEQNRARLGQTDLEGIQPVKALKVYLESRNTPKNRIEVLLQHAEKLMQEHPEV